MSDLTEKLKELVNSGMAPFKAAAEIVAPKPAEPEPEPDPPAPKKKQSAPKPPAEPVTETLPAEPVEDPDAAQLAPGASLRRIKAALRGQGTHSDEQILAWVNSQLGRTITVLAELTAKEAAVLLDQLSRSGA